MDLPRTYDKTTAGERQGLKRRRRRRELQQQRAMAEGMEGQRARAAGSSAASIARLLQGPQRPKAVTAAACNGSAGSWLSPRALAHLLHGESLFYLFSFFFLNLEKRKRGGKQLCNSPGTQDSSCPSPKQG